MAEWCAPEHRPVVIASGRGALLRDADGREYIDGNASIWTNIHGHNHPRINRALEEQLGKIAHCSALGATNEPAIRLAARLAAFFPAGENPLHRIFFTDDGSTAMECAIKMAVQFWQIQGQSHKREFLAFARAYHGDTLGAASLGGIETFHARFSGLGLHTHHVTDLDALEKLPAATRENLAGVAIEPLMQGAAGMRPWPQGMLARLRDWCRRHDVLLILDEVLTGFGRTGKMFACQHEDVVPDFLALAKGLSGGYLPLAATLTTERVYRAFAASGKTDNTFYYGHSYCGNPLGCAAALASLDVFEEENTLASLAPLIEHFAKQLEELQARTPHVGEVRRCGLIAGIELMHDPAQRTPFPPEKRTGARACLAARNHGLLTRPIGDTIVLMPPLCITQEQIDRAVEAIHFATLELTEKAGRT